MREFFYRLDLKDKVELISDQGKLLMTTNFFGSSIKLYELNGYFIEVYHHPVLHNIMRISVATEAELDKHLEGIDLNKL